MKNSQHLKAYVQMHPDNKMAWYLLGKEYYKNGQQGKANYCFNQAGEVYEAFERSKVPAEMLREYEEGLLQAGRVRERGKQRIRYILLAVMLLVLIIVPSAVAPGLDIPGEEEPLLEVLAPEIANKPDQVANDEGVHKVVKGVMFTAQEGEDSASSGKLMASVLKSKESTQVAVLGMKRSGKWLLWKNELPLKSALLKTGDGRIVYQSYDSAACACEPPAQGELTKLATKWQADQEALAVLWSGVMAYQSATGKLPETLQALTGDFPKNWVGGTTPVMERQFRMLRRVAISRAVQGTPKATAEPSNSASEDIKGVIPTAISAGGSDQKGILYFDEPLKVIVDKQRHRLAISSGSIMIRNYAVGLGGDQTPEGSFVITDKVVNPNGRDNGEFGSRGLQLSDSNYAIHGTNEPDSIGKDESLGCIRMSREDVEELFALVPKGTKVVITKGVLPEQLLLPEIRFTSAAPHDQTNPHKVYHWLN